MGQLAQRAELIHSGCVDPREDNMLKITHEARLLGLDCRCMNPEAVPSPDSKVNKLLDNLVENYNTTMAEIINPNNPVYFTYARNSEEKAEWRHIADVVPDLLDAFRSECVKYSVDVEDIKNGAKISSYEKEIGDANYVIVVLSDRYFYRYHCMFELSNVLKNTQGKTIKFIKSGNFNIKNIDYRQRF